MEQRVFHEFPQEEIPYVREYQEWETTKGYQQMNRQSSSPPSLFWGSSAIPLICGV